MIDTAEASKDPSTARLDTRAAGTAVGDPPTVTTPTAGATTTEVAPEAPTTPTPAPDTAAPEAPTRAPEKPTTPTAAPDATTATAPVAPGAPAEEIAPAEGRLGRLRGRLSRSRTGLGQSLLGLLGAGQMDEESWEDVEATLLQADLGPEMTEEITTQLREQLATRAVRTADQARAVLHDVLTGRSTRVRTGPCAPCRTTGDRPSCSSSA